MNKRLILLGLISSLVLTFSNPLPAEDGVNTPDLSAKLKHVKVITFDFYAALSNIKPGLEKQITTILTKHRVSEAQLSNFMKFWFEDYGGLKNYNAYIRNRKVRKYLEGKDIFDIMLKSSTIYELKNQSISPTPELVNDLVQVWNNIDPQTDALSSLLALKAKGYKIGILSNGSKSKLISAIENNAENNGKKWTDLFDYIFSSSEVKCFKPEPKFYAQVMEVTGLKKHEILHIAGADFDAVGARSFGYVTGWNSFDKGNKPFLNYLMSDEFMPEFILHELSDLVQILPDRTKE